MPSIKDTTPVLDLPCEDDPSDRFVVRYTNRGEPYREGISISLISRSEAKELTGMLESKNAIRLRDLLVQMYPGG